METIIITVLAIFFVTGVLFSPQTPQKLVVGSIPHSNLYMTRPYKFEPFVENGYFIIEDDNLGILVYGQTIEELHTNLYKEIQELHNAFSVMEDSNVIVANFNKLVKLSKEEIRSFIPLTIY